MKLKEKNDSLEGEEEIKLIQTSVDPQEKAYIVQCYIIAIQQLDSQPCRQLAGQMLVSIYPANYLDS